MIPNDVPYHSFKLFVADQALLVSERHNGQISWFFDLDKKATCERS